MNPLQQLSSEALLEQGTSLVKKTAQVVGQQMQSTASTAVSQVTGQPVASPSDGGAMAPIQRDKQTEDFVKELYGTTVQKPAPKRPSISDKPPGVKEKEEKSVTDEKLSDTRQKLAQLLQSQHTNVYYNPTFNRPLQQEEEKPVEKLEREKKMADLEKREKNSKKPPPLAVQMGQSKAERFPGASG